MQKSFLSLPIPRFVSQMPVDSLPKDEDLSPADPTKKFVESIKRHGVLSPIVVQEDGPRLRLIYGNRRLKAARKAGYEEVPVLVYQQGDELPDDISVAENEHRSPNPVDLYLRIKELFQSEKTEKEIATQLGLSLNKVRQFVAVALMNNLAFEQAWFGKQISDTFILSIAKRGKDEQRLALEVLGDKGKATLVDLKEIRREGAKAALATLDSLAPSIFSDSDQPPYCLKARAAGDGVEVELFVNGERREVKVSVDKLVELLV